MQRCAASSRQTSSKLRAGRPSSTPVSHPIIAPVSNLVGLLVGRRDRPHLPCRSDTNAGSHRDVTPHAFDYLAFVGVRECLPVLAIFQSSPNSPGKSRRDQGGDSTRDSPGDGCSLTVVRTHFSLPFCRPVQHDRPRVAGPGQGSCRLSYSTLG